MCGKYMNGKTTLSFCCRLSESLKNADKSKINSTQLETALSETFFGQPIHICIMQGPGKIQRKLLLQSLTLPMSGSQQAALCV